LLVNQAGIKIAEVTTLGYYTWLQILSDADIPYTISLNIRANISDMADIDDNDPKYHWPITILRF